MAMFGKVLVVVGFVTFFFNFLIGGVIFIIGLFLGLLGTHWDVMEQGGRDAVKKREQEKREYRKTKARRLGQKMGNFLNQKGS